MDTPLLTVVVCTYNRAGQLEGCLQSLVDQRTDAWSYEVLVVDNNSTDHTRQIIEAFSASFPQVKGCFEPQQGLSHARNRGWREARGRFVAYLDDDARASRHWCARIVDAFEQVVPTPAAVGGVILPFYDSTPPWWFSDRLEIRSWGNSPGFLTPPRARSGFSGGNMAFARETLEGQGGFSADYGMKGEALGLGEETELFQRLFDAGACFWYDPEIEVKHWVPQRNMQIGYRLKRAFRAGTTCARLGRSQFMSATYLKCVWSLALTLVRAPKTILSARDGIVTGSVLWLQDVGYCLGYLAGQSRLP